MEYSKEFSKSTAKKPPKGHKRMVEGIHLLGSGDICLFFFCGRRIKTRRKENNGRKKQAIKHTCIFFRGTSLIPNKIDFIPSLNIQGKTFKKEFWKLKNHFHYL
jgi:hypothetical protein